MHLKRGFTLIELLVTLAILAILAAVSMPAIGRAKVSGKKAACQSNLRQVNLAVRLYTDDEHDRAPKHANKTFSGVGYKRLVRKYTGAPGESSLKDRLFACPADRFHHVVTNGGDAVLFQPLHNQASVDFSSYGFNGGNMDTSLVRFGLDVSQLGIAGRTVSSIRNPSRTVLVMEFPATDPFSWHDPQRPIGASKRRIKDARDMVSFVDGHVSYVTMYWRDVVTNHASLSASHFNPPPEYGYQWSGD